MYGAATETAPEVIEHVSHLVKVTGAAMLVGWATERLLDTGVRIPGIGIAAGIVGYLVGSWFWDVTGWPYGLILATVPVAPVVAGAIAVCGFLKLAGIAAASPRR